ncbi:MAG: hypothetical protein ACYDGM_11770 [Vulcanimicrobiaceae bacterium]
MTPPRRGKDRGRRVLLWALFCSAALHAILIPLLLWLSGWHFFMPRPQNREFVVSSTSVRIEHRTIPRPESAAGRHPAHSTPKSRPSSQRPLPKTVAPQPQPHELAREVPNAPPQPPRRRRAASRQETLAQQLAQQQQTFSKEVAQLNAGNNPHSIATIAPQPPSADERSYYDLNGKTRPQDRVMVLLTPLQHWIAGAASCYYVRYAAEFSSGGSDDGNIPWPVCYPRSDDPIAKAPPGMGSFPVPVPVPPHNYVLPKGTYLTPLLQQIYDGKIKNSKPA